MSNIAPGNFPKRPDEERRLLIRSLLELYGKQGGRVVLPMTEDDDDSLFDRIHVSILVEALRTSQYVDIGKLLNDEEEPCNGRVVHDGTDPGMELDVQTELVLHIPQLVLQLDEHELQEMAFMFFCLFCVDDGPSNLTTPLRRQLELSTSCAEDIIKIAKRVRQRPDKRFDVCETVGVDQLLKLIEDIRPQDFRKFRDFVKWRDVIARVLIQVMKESVQPAADSAKVSLLLANLKGAVRRLCFREENEFEEEEYTDAIRYVSSIAHKLVPYSQSGFSFPWGLRICLWETLLAALFEACDEDDIYVDEMETLKSQFLKHLAPRLQISPALHDASFAWVHFKQLSATRFPALCPPLKILLTAVTTNDPPVDEMDRLYVTEITHVCFASLKETLMDYHARLTESEVMSGMVDLFLTLTQTLPSGDARQRFRLEECVASSCEKAFLRIQQSHTEGRKDSPFRVQQLAEETMELYEMELLKYTGGLAPFCPNAAAVAAKALHECFGQELKPVLYELKNIPEDVVRMLKAADALEIVLMKEISHEPSTASSVVPWNVMDAISELLFHWVETQLHKIKEWRERLVQEETWQPKSTTNPLSASAVEYRRLLEESIALVFSLDLNFPENLVDKFVSGLAIALKSYADSTMSDIRGEEGIRLLIPRVPELTRYKKELADSAALKESSADSKPPHKRHSRLKSILLDSSVTRMVPLIEESENYQWFNNLKINTLIVRINSLHFLRESIPELSAMLESNSSLHGVQKDMGKQNSVEPLWTASIELDRCVNAFCRFLGTKIVFWDGRIRWLEQLYRHHVESSRMDYILADLHKNLMDINSVALDSVRNKIVHSVLEACAAGLKRVLLEGGPYRLFKSGSDGNDRELIEEDVKKLKDLFNDEEEGLPMTLIEDTTKPVLEILLQMSLSTSNLIQLAEDARRTNTRDITVYTQILGHRIDRAASKWLKKVLKTPKKMKTKL